MTTTTLRSFRSALFLVFGLGLHALGCDPASQHEELLADVRDANLDARADDADVILEFDCAPKCLEYGELTSHCLYLTGTRSVAFQMTEATPLVLESIQRALPLTAQLDINTRTRVLRVDGLEAQDVRTALALNPFVQFELPMMFDGTAQVVRLPEVVLGVEPGVSKSKVQRLARSVGLRVVRPLAVPNTWLLSGEGAALSDLGIAKSLRAHEEVRYANANLLRRLRQHNDPLYPAQWYLHNTGQNEALPGADLMAEEAWSVTTGDRNVIIAVHDDGVDVDHPEFKDKIVYAGGDRNKEVMLRIATDRGYGSHGTAVAGVAAALADNNAGGRGVCPECSVMPLLISQGLIPGTLSLDDATVAEDIVTAVDAGASVFNASWGPAGGDPALYEDPPASTAMLPPVVADAFAYAESEGRGGLGTVVVFAAGNSNQDTSISDPYLSAPTVIAVAAYDDQGRKSGYSSFGDAVDIAAPSSGGRTAGVIAPLPQKGTGYLFQGLWETRVDGPSGEPYTLNFGGTSSAAPLISGVVGLMMASNPNITAAEVRSILRDTAIKIDRLGGAYDESTGHSPYYGYGAVNAYAAVIEAQRLGGTCDTSRMELCNGVDDNCNGKTDDVCAKADTCAPCQFDAACHSGVCARTPGDASSRCLESCRPNGQCDAGFECLSGMCVPENTGRCAPCLAEELCNGIDDNCDGVVDEGACDHPTSEDERCYYDGECAPGWQCTATRRCAWPCHSDDDCVIGTVCERGATRFGEEAGGICYRDTVTQLCLDWLCDRQPAQNSHDFFGCVDDLDEHMCGAVFACALVHLDPAAFGAHPSP